MFVSTLLTLAALSAPASAGTNELAFELGALGSSDRNWDLFSDGPLLSSMGLRAGYGVNDWLTVVGTWQTARDGSVLYIESYDANEYLDQDALLSLRTNQLSLGPKFSLDLFSWLHPYATVQGLALLGTVRMDDDAQHDDNLNQYKSSAVTGGGFAALGLDFILLREDRPIRPATYLEMGYGRTANLAFDDIGTLGFGGFALRWGVGARF